MKRFALALFILFSWLFLIGAASTQITIGEESPPQTDLFNDALFLARAIPFLAGLGIIAGITQARAAAQGKGGDAIIGEEVRRHDTGIILTHWMNATGLILGLFTGSIMLRWVDRPVEQRIIFIIHYLGAALTMFAIFNHLGRQGVSGGTGLLPKKFSIIRDLILELLEYTGLFGPEGAALRIPWPKVIRRPIARYVRAFIGKESPAGKFLSTEKTLSYPPWAILIGTIVVTGLIKSLRYVYDIPSTLVASSTAIHDLAAIAIGVMLVFHLLPLLFVPANWPLLLSIFRTTVSRKYVEKRHPAWYKELEASQNMQEQALSEGEASSKGATQAADAPSGD